MHFSTSATAALLLASSVLAVPHQKRTSSTVKQVKNPHFRGKNGAIAYERDMLKHGKPVPEEVASAAAAARAGHYGSPTPVAAARAAGETGSEVNTPATDDEEYLCEVEIGTPAQTLLLDFDTGSSDLWVYSSQTPKADVTNQTVYDITSSSSATKLTGYTWSISYGDGSSCSGDVYTDVVTVGGVSVTKQAVESAETVSSQFSSAGLDGLLGLGYSKLNTVSPTAQDTWFASASSDLASYVMTIDLKAGEAGTYNFGYIDDSLYTGDISYVDVVQHPGYWRFTGSGYAIGDGKTVSADIDAIADTGTTLIYLATAIVDAYWAEVDSATYSALFGGWVFDCDATLPDFSITIGDFTGTVPGSYLNYAQELGKCFGGLQRDTSVGIGIIGDVGLKAFFVVLDGENNQIGWASKTISS